MTRFSKTEIEKASKKIRENIKKGNGYPSNVNMVEMDKGKTIKVTKPSYMGLFEAQNVFVRNHGRKPHYVTLNSKANNPLVMDYQDNPYTCCPTSFSMATQLLFDNISEKECAKALGTVQGSGTDPSNLVNNAKKLGYKVTRIPRNYKNVKASLDKGNPVIAHIQTKPATCLGYAGDYGHYVLIYGAYKKLLTSYYKIADPTKGLVNCKSNILDKATNGRQIHYYKVEIQ